MIMSLVWTSCVIFSFLGSSQSVVFVTSNDAKNVLESSAGMIFRDLQLPWLNGTSWLARTTESPRLENVKTLIRGIESGEEWALRMLSDFSQSQREIRLKNIQKIGTYDRCTGENASSKSANPAAQFLSHVIKSGSVSSELESAARQGSCKRAVQDAFTRDEIYAIFLIASICVFVFACTICDFMKRRTSKGVSTIVDTMSKFSLYTNAIKLLNTNVTSDTISAIHGLRFLSCSLVIIAHHYSLIIVLLRRQINILDILTWRRSWVVPFLSMAFLSVDTFFVISGFLTAYMFFTAKKSGIKFNMLTMYVLRYSRLTPCLGVVILFAMTFWHRIGSLSGSQLDPSLPILVDACRKNWWTHLLFIQNIVNKDDVCLPQFWYLAVDTQLFWISPMILYSLHSRPRIGLLILSFFLFGTVFTSAFLLAVNGYSNAAIRLDTDFPKAVESFNTYYTSTFLRSFPYFLGILLGFDMAVRKRCLTQMNVAINWVAACSLISFSVWAMYKIHHFNFAYDLRIEIILTLLMRPSWSVAMAWIIYASTQGYGGFVTRLFSLPVFIPLSRLSYCLYLVHMFVQAYYITNSNIPSTLSGFEISSGIFVELIVSIVMALLLCLFIESPVIVAVKMLTSRRFQPKRVTAVQQPFEKGKVAVQH